MAADLPAAGRVAQK